MKTEARIQKPEARASTRLDALARVTNVVAELCHFAQVHGAPCFVGWPENILREYLWFHIENGSLFYVRDPHTRKMIALFIGWQCKAHRIGLHWQVSDPEGDAFYFDNVVCHGPGAMRSVVHEFCRRWPHWRKLALFANRRPRGVVRWSPKLIERMERA